MPSVLIQRPSDEGFLHKDADGYISRETITLVAGTYDSGSVVISDGGGNFALATQALVDADANGDAKYAIVCRFTTSTVPVKAAGITYHASVKSSELITGAGLTVAEVTPLLAKQHILVRTAV